MPSSHYIITLYQSYNFLLFTSSEWNEKYYINLYHSKTAQRMSLWSEYSIEPCQLNLTERNLIWYICLVAFSTTPECIENINIKQAWYSSWANGSSQLVFTLGANWDCSSLMDCTIAAYLLLCSGKGEEKKVSCRTQKRSAYNNHTLRM